MGAGSRRPAMLTKMTDADWVTVLKVFEGSRSRRGDKGHDDKKRWPLRMFQAADQHLRISSGQQEVLRREQEVLRSERFLTMHHHVVTRTKCDRAFVGGWIECRDVELTKIRDPYSRDVDVVGPPVWSHS